MPRSFGAGCFSVILREENVTFSRLTQYAGRKSQDGRNAEDLREETSRRGRRACGVASGNTPTPARRSQTHARAGKDANGGKSKHRIQFMDQMGFWDGNMYSAGGRDLF